jgi:hypothetical protein
MAIALSVHGRCWSRKGLSSVSSVGGKVVRIGGGAGVRSTVEHRNRLGQLIAVQRNYDLWPAYQRWRARWCEKHRHNWTIRGFREGKVNPLTLSFALILRIQEVLNGTR